jgi:hypothetical protein
MPTEYSEDIVLTHPSVPPSALFDDLRSDFYQTSSITVVRSDPVPSDKFWWVQACSGWHNTAMAQNMRISVSAIHGNSVANREVVLASEGNVVSSGGGQVQFQVPRRFIVPPGGMINCHITTAVGGTGPIVQFQYLELDVGQEIW